MAEVKFCENNFNFGTDKVASKLQENSNATVIIEPCLGHCGDCVLGPYALVNDEMVQADRAEQLYEDILNLI